jgi:CRISPR/Cas system-associated exonuclease Cas4 (RecB family)
METFLQNTAKYLYGKYGDRLSDCAVIFPNRRAGLFFARHLSGIIEKPLWLPGMFTISDLMEEVSSLKRYDPVSLSFELYTVFRKVTGSLESFDEFYTWSEILLADFDEIDKNMVDAPALFRNLSDLKNLDDRFDYYTAEQIEAIRGFWSTFNPGSHTLHQKEFIRIWEALPEIYSGYKKHLSERNLAYEGMIFSHVAKKVNDGTVKMPDYYRYFIAGFNALNQCEKIFFDFLQREGMAEFFWDYDEFYTLEPSHQAGVFMRGNLSRYPHSGFIQNNTSIREGKKEIDIIAVPSNTGQTKTLHGLRDMFGENEPLNTAIVLPDEGLLLPVLSSLPDVAGEINVTMGYPLKDTSIYGFIMNLLNLHRNSRIPGSEGPRGEPGEVLFHYRDVLALIRHPDFACENDAVYTGLIKEIREKNHLYLGGSHCGLSEFGKIIFRMVPTDIRFTDYLIDILMFMVKFNKNNPATDEKNSIYLTKKEFIYKTFTSIGRIREIFAGSETGLRFETLVKILKKVLSGVRVPFYGEPLGGVQVMGVLETRALDFENVIIMSVNEGIFPAAQTGSSFIPYTLRKGYGLPVGEEQDAVYAYYFYRLLQRTRRMILVYNTHSDGLFTGEMSRFIYQLKFDGGFNIRERSLVFNMLQNREVPVYIEKTAGIMNQLKTYTGDGPDGRYLSAAAINSYLDCTLKFYFRYIAGLYEPDAVIEEIDMAAFGNLFHHAAQTMYAPFAGRELKGRDIDTLLANRDEIETFVYRAFSRLQNGHGNTGNDNKIKEPGGIDLIISGVLVTYLQQLLMVDRKLVPFRIEALEGKYSGKIEVEQEGEKLVVRAGGYIDRVDLDSGTIRVVDYKTGNDDADFKSVESLFKRGDSKRRRAVFQTFFYAWLYLENSGTGSRISPLLYQMRKSFGNEQMVIFHKPGTGVNIPVLDFRDYHQEFAAGLKSVISELFDEKVGFSQAEDTDICRYCPYSRLCHRE